MDKLDKNYFEYKEIVSRIAKKLLAESVDSLIKKLFAGSNIPCPSSFKIIEECSGCLIFEWEFQAKEGSARHDNEKYLSSFKLDGGLTLNTMLIGCDDFTGIYTLRTVYNGRME